MKPKFLVLTGDGINCERETAKAFEKASASAQIMHINDLLERPKFLGEFQGLAIPGGFSFGDELGSGQILALKIRHGLDQEFLRFIDQKRPIIGICNGFQVLVKLGALPVPHKERSMSLAQNTSGHFLNRWAQLNIDKASVCKWTQGIDLPSMELPVRHGEGRIVFTKGMEESIYLELKNKGQIPFTYEEDINGSFKKIAGVCDESGLILGMMPHPEAFISNATFKNKSDKVLENGSGLLLFENIVRYLRNN
jgi:phosphoribosylformylglycinamidine synthase subunit PurQ / glutaminase